MEFERLVEAAGQEPFFETGLLLAGDVNPNTLRQQLTRWVRSGRIVQLRRGVYTLAPPYRQVKANPFVLANALVRGSYVSLQSALAYWGWIPEYVQLTQSVTTRRPARWATPLGGFEYRHIKPDLFFGYSRIEVSADQFAFVATPEKALLDLIHLTPGGDLPAFLDELRLQNLDQLHPAEIERMAVQSGQPKLKRAARYVVGLSGREKVEFESV